MTRFLHFFRLHAWESLGTMGSPATGILTRQRCTICDRTRVTNLNP
jgi:hypothetical protein